MTLTYVPHEKIDLRTNSEFNEAWVHDRICDDPTILGLDDVRVLDRERAQDRAGRLDILLFDEDNNRRYEVEVMLGATDPSHIIRCIEYWDIERRRYPGYDHVAVLIAEDVTTRFLNVMSLLSGSIPLIAIQLDALRVGDQVLLNFVHVLDQTDLRVDDTDDNSSGGQKDRAYWDQKVGPDLMRTCDEVLGLVNEAAATSQEFSYKQQYIGLQSNGVVRNPIWLIPKPTKNIIHMGFLNSNATAWNDRFEEAGVRSRTIHKRKLRITVTPDELGTHRDLIRNAIGETVRAFGA